MAGNPGEHGVGVLGRDPGIGFDGRVNRNPSTKSAG